MEVAEPPNGAITIPPSAGRRIYYPAGIPVIGLWFAFLTIAFSDTGPSIEALLLFKLGCGALLLFWAIRGVRTVASWVSNRRHPSVSLRPFRYCVIEPSLLLLSFLYVESGIPRWTRFRLSESSLDAHVRSILDGRFVFENVNSDTQPKSSTDFSDYMDPWGTGARAWDTRSQIVGLYEIERTHWMKSGEIVFEMRRGSTGLMYTTAPNDEKFGELGWIFRWSHLSGPWWRYEEDF